MMYLRTCRLRILLGDVESVLSTSHSQLAFPEYFALEACLFAQALCCNPLLDCFLCDSRSLLPAVLCLFWPYMGPWGPPLARHPSQPVATLQHFTPYQPFSYVTCFCNISLGTRFNLKRVFVPSISIPLEVNLALESAGFGTITLLRVAHHSSTRVQNIASKAMSWQRSWGQKS